MSAPHRDGLPTSPRPAPMALESFRVRMYRSIIDSGPVPVFPLTALVGRARLGKTSLLRALETLDPGPPPDLSFDTDWPRHRFGQRSRDQSPCTADFRLSPPAAAAFDELMGHEGEPQSSASARFARVGRTYAGELWIDDVSESATGSRAAARRARRAPPPPTLDERLDFLRGHMPGFLALDEEAPLDAESLREVGPAARELCAVAGLDVETLRAPRRGDAFDPACLREASGRANAALARGGGDWRLKLRMGRARLEVLATGDGGKPMELERWSEERRWRLGVDLAIAARTDSYDRLPILLLDGPGRCFRRSGPEGLRRALAELASAGHTVLYTARLPFRVDLQHPEQVLVMAPGERGPTVGEPLARDAASGESELTVRAALGITGRASFAIGEHNLVVEGPSDADVLAAFDRLLRRSSEPGLPDGVNLLVAGGAHEVARTSAFLARQRLSAVALFDSDAAGDTGRALLQREAERHHAVRRVPALMLARCAGLDADEAAIEDLFPDEAYLDAVREVCRARGWSAPLRHLSAPTSGRISSHVERLFEPLGFPLPKRDVIARLCRSLDSMEHVERLDPSFSETVRRLIRTLREAVEEQDRASRP